MGRSVHRRGASTVGQLEARAEVAMRAELPAEFCERGRPIYGPTPPSGAIPCQRTSRLSDAEIAEVASLIARGRLQRRDVQLPERLKTRDWGSVERVVLALDEVLGWEGGGWKVGAASADVRRSEGLPSPTPGRIYKHAMFPSGARLAPELFINYRNCECEFAFELGLDFPPREAPYTEADAAAGVATLLPALELGDMVFVDWYGASAYFGSCLDNGGGAAFVAGTRATDWSCIDLPGAGMDLYLNGTYIKSGTGAAAMGHPLTSLTWMLNWARVHGLSVTAGEIVSTGTCTGHLFAAPGDDVTADFGALGTVVAIFAETRS